MKSDKADVVFVLALVVVVVLVALAVSVVGVGFGHTPLDRIPLSIQYIQDPRTGLCFAYHRAGGSDGGPALATVDCATVTQWLSH